MRLVLALLLASATFAAGGKLAASCRGDNTPAAGRTLPGPAADAAASGC